MGPLGRLRSLKIKVGIVVIAAIAMTLASILVADALGARRLWGVVVAVPVTLLAVQLLARGTTAPLREITAAAEAMTRGEHGRQVPVRGHDEVARLARSFNAMSMELAETDRMRRDLVANVAHELRTPLAGIRATLENIEDGVQRGDATTVSALAEQIDRLDRMVEQLLDLSRMEDGEPLQLGQVALAPLLERVAGECRGAAAAVEVVVHPAELAVVADAERLHQLTANLLENALRYSPKGAAVRMEAVATPASVRIAVADRGPGIPAAERERVFERFYSADPSRQGAHAGLGLAVVRWIAELHGGTARVADAEPGCTIEVELPRSPRQGGDDV